MKLPNLQVIENAQNDIMVLEKNLKEAHLGENPIAIIASKKLTEDSTRELLLTLKEICDGKHIHPKLPYPIFIVTIFDIQSDHFALVRSKEEITNYYRLKIKKLKKRETHLLGKVKTYTTRINHYRLEEAMNIMKAHSLKHHSLKSVCKEKAFYSDVLNKIKNAEQRS